jgi:hypothetical protein
MEVLGGRYDAGMRRFHESRVLAEATSDERGVANATSGLGTIARYKQDYAEARARHATSLEIRRRLGESYEIAASLGDLGVAAYLQRDFDVADASHTESLAIAQQIGDPRGTGRCLGNMASVAFARGDLRRAETLSRESLTIWREVGDRWAFASSLDRFAGLAAAHGASRRALRLAGAGARLREVCGTPLAPAGQAELDRWLAGARTSIGPTAARAAWMEGEAMAESDAVAYALDASSATSSLHAPRGVDARFMAPP